MDAAVIIFGIMFWMLASAGIVCLMIYCYMDFCYYKWNKEERQITTIAESVSEAIRENSNDDENNPYNL